MVKKSTGSFKYVFLVAVAVIILRIDYIAELGEKAFQKFGKKEAPVTAEELGDSPVVVRSGKNVELTPRQKYMAFIDNFRVSPELVFREEAMNLFKKHPQMFTEKLDRDLEARVYRWRDLVVQNEAELPLFLLDLYGILRSENREMITRFFSVVLDLNFEMFMSSYPRTKDPACAPVTMIEAAVPSEDKFSELTERLEIIEGYLRNDKLSPDRRLYATLCLNVLRDVMAKETSKPLTDADAEAPEEAPNEESGETP